VEDEHGQRTYVTLPAWRARPDPVGRHCMTADLRSFFTFRSRSKAASLACNKVGTYVRNTALRARNKHDPRHACVNLKHVCLSLPTTITTVLERKGF
jgi:hypothetical protein